MEWPEWWPSSRHLPVVRPIVAVALLPLMIGGYALVWGVLPLTADIRLWRHRDAGSA